MNKNWQNFTRTTGIYLIVHEPSQRAYVGQSKDICRRWKKHLYLLQRKEHHCQSLQDCWNESHYTDFHFKVVHICKKSELTKKEQEYWDKQEKNPFNGRPTNHTYPTATPQTRKKISESRKGITFTKEHKKNLAEAQKGKRQSEHTKRKRSEALKIPVVQYSKENQFIKEWPSATDAAEELGIHRSHIYSVCTGKRKSTGGFVWKYRKEGEIDTE